MSKRYLGIIPKEHQVRIVNAVQYNYVPNQFDGLHINWEGQEVDVFIAKCVFNERFKCEGMDFSLALTGMRLGLKVRRSVWHPEMSTYLEDGILFIRDEDGDYEVEGYDIDGLIIEDILATDWEIVQ
jgi:hypothetical protein